MIDYKTTEVETSLSYTGEVSEDNITVDAPETEELCLYHRAVEILGIAGNVASTFAGIEFGREEAPGLWFETLFELRNAIDEYFDILDSQTNDAE